MWLIFARKLPFSVRMHLFMGIMAYLGSPLWFLFLALGTWIAWDRYSSELSQLPFESYAARWFHIDGIQQSIILTAVIFALLFLPKILAVTGAILTPSIRRSFGGALRILIGASLETIVSMLLAPCIMVAHSLMVLSIILGRAVGWGNQNRETDGTAWGDAFRFHAPQTILGLIWTAIAINIGYHSKNSGDFTSKYAFALWMTPILLGLLLSAPVSVWTSRSRYGRALLKNKILATPEELNPPSVILLADRATAAVDPALDASTDSRRGVVAAVVDPYVNGVHVSLLEHSELMPAEEALAERCLSEGPTGLSKNELSELLYAAPAMLMMHRAVWLRPAEGIHNTWTQAVESYRRRLDQSPAA
jgi:membrane glycosyltransferase